MYIVLAILVFGVLIATHELGHFVAAKKLGVKVNEFSIGMGPKIFSRQRGETLYSIRLLVILGGSCVMEGEDALVLEEDAEGGDAKALPDEAELGAETYAYITEQYERLDTLFAGQRLGKQRPTSDEIHGFLREWVASHKDDDAAMTPPTEQEFHQWRYNKRERERRERKEAIDRAYKRSVEMGDDERMRLFPRAFTSQKRWKRAIILAAGAAMNFLAGVIILLCLNMGENEIVGTRLAGFMDGFPGVGETGLLAGDKIISVNGNSTHYADDFSMFMTLSEGENDGMVDLVVRRGREKVRLDNFPLELREYEVDGQIYIRYGLLFERIEASIFERLKHSLYLPFNFARVVRIALVQLVTGQAPLREMSGPVGIVSVIGEAGSNPQLPTVGARLTYVFTITALVAVNLAVFNLLPLPALDGGRIFGLIVTYVIEKITRRRVNPKYEGYVHAAGLALLLLLSVFIMINDVIKLI
jgi:regulator of sigma E protease